MKIVKLLFLTIVFVLSAALVNAVVTDITIQSPINGTTYNTNFFKVNDWRVGRIQVDVMLDEDADYLQISYDGTRFKTLCRRCDSYNRSRSFGRNKDYNLTFRAIDSGQIIDLGTITFTKDTTPPRIIKQLPRKRSYVNGTYPPFAVVYNEQKLGNITIFWKGLSDPTYQHQVITGCPEGIRKQCNTTLDLSTFDGEQVVYYFAVNDTAGNTRTRSPTTVNVDLIPPTITIVRPQEGNYSVGRVYLEVAINEKVDLLQYELDFSNKWITLCRRCYQKRKPVFISTSANHTIVVKGTDFVGHVNETAVNITLT